tara:strand:+ start:560 stop:1234 length:675 start_codon:yes stop_codon:yes gene_type:complete
MELRGENYHDWLWIPMLLLFSFMAFIFTKYNDQVRRCFLAVVSNREFNDLVRDESQVSKRASLALNIFSLFTYAAFLFLFAINFLQTELSYLELYLAINGLFFGGFILKILFIYALGELFQEQNSSNLYVSNSLLSNEVFGIVLFPLILVIAYSQVLVEFFLYSSIIIWMLASVFKWYKGIKFGLSLSELPIIYPFLYICTLEILPVLVLAKVFLAPLEKIALY